MKKQPDFRRQIGLPSEWFDQFATQLSLANVILQLEPTQVTNIVKDARFGRKDLRER
jgi:hypothetical protein